MKTPLYHVTEYLLCDPDTHEVTLVRGALNEWPEWAASLRRELFDKPPEPIVKRTRPARFVRRLANALRSRSRSRPRKKWTAIRSVTPDGLHRIADGLNLIADELKAGRVAYESGGIVLCADRAGRYCVTSDLKFRSNLL